MDYYILDEIMELSNKRREKMLDGGYFISSINELTDPYEGSSDFIHAYLFKNFVEKNGSLSNLIIIIRDKPTGKQINGFELNNVEMSIYTLPITSDERIKLNKEPKAPEIHPDDEKFIIEKRSLPKKPYDPNIAFNPDLHKWSTMQIAEHLHISNRTVGAYCKAHNI